MTTTPSFLAGRASEMAASNPANAPEKAPRQRIPMSLPNLKLAVPEIPGYHLYWFRGTSRVQQALQAGYQFVERGEVELNHEGLANDYEQDGNSDLGTRVSRAAGGEEEGSQGVRLYLMKIRNELYDEDQRAIDEKHEAIAAQMRGDKGFTSTETDPRELAKRYSRGESRNLFQPRRAK